LTACRLPHRLMRELPLIMPHVTISNATSPAATLEIIFLLRSTTVMFAAHESHEAGTGPESELVLTLTSLNLVSAAHDAGSGPESSFVERSRVVS
jgi:hypothetical protein